MWQEYFERLSKSGVLGQNSLEIFAKWCVVAAKTRRLAKKTDKDSVVEWRQTMALERLLAIELGLSPASQAKVVANVAGGDTEKEKGILQEMWANRK